MPCKIFIRREFESGGKCDGVWMSYNEWLEIKTDNDFEITIPYNGRYQESESVTCNF